MAYLYSLADRRKLISGRFEWRYFRHLSEVTARQNELAVLRFRVSL